MLANYERLLVIEKGNEDIFTNNIKKELNNVEKAGLEIMLADFIASYEEEVFGEIYSTNIRDIIRWNENSVDILDGYYNTYIFDNYAIGSMWMLTNGVVVLEIADLDTIGSEDETPEEKVANYDIWSDCDVRLARID